MKRSIEYRFEQKIKHGELNNVTIITENGEEILYGVDEKPETKQKKIKKNKQKEMRLDEEYEFI